MTKTFMQRNRDRIARVRTELLASTPPRVQRIRMAQSYQPRPIDRSTGICYYELGVGLIDLCHVCADQQGYREALGGSERRCESCGKRPAVAEQPHATRSTP